MRRALWAVATTVVGVAWVITFRVTPLAVDAVAAEPSHTRSPAPTPSSRATGPVATLVPQSAPPQSAVPGTAAGTFTGALVDTRYGPVQLRIVVSGGRVTDVQALTLPRDRARSAAISQYSAPILRSEAIQAQSARIDVVSGATYTSVAYARSLDSALKQAHLG